jgi:hypothetical protein
METPTPDQFVSGSLATGRLILITKSGLKARCEVLMCLGTLTDNLDSTFNLNFPGGS